MKRSRDDVVTGSAQDRRITLSPGQAQMSTASSAQKLTTDDAMTYLKAVKDIFQDRKDKYEEFLEIMKDFKAQRVDTNGVTARVKELFKGHRDLILGFNTFLPAGYKITLTPEDERSMKNKPLVEFEEAIKFVNKIKARFKGDDRIYRSFLEILNGYRRETKIIKDVYHEVSKLFQNHADLLVEFTHFLPAVAGTASTYMPRPGRDHILFGDGRVSPMTTPRSIYVDKNPAVPYPVRDGYTDNQDSEWNRAEKEKGKGEDRDNNEWEDGDSSDHKRKIARRDESLTDQFHQGTLNPISAICEKVQNRLQDPENYKKFLNCVRSYESKFVSMPQFRKLVENILGAHPDLMDVCEELITYVERTGAMRASKQISRSLKVDDRDGDHHDKEERDKDKDFSNRERDRYDRGLAINPKDLPALRMSSYASKEKFLLKPIQELDLSNCESCTPSYRLLPENYPIPLASRRTEIGNQVLNDHWVSVTSGSEDYSFKHMRKNQYEESLFRCEDDRFELDMLLESVNATAIRVEELLDGINANTNKLDSTFCIEDHLTALNLRCIERLYGDHGLDVMDVLRKNAPLALPVILTRLKQKQEEWAKCRAEFNKVWAEIYAKNYHKSLDHRSFYFKQQDTKNLSAKALLGEIKDKSEKNQNEDEVILSISAGYRQPIRPHIEFEYRDPEIQEDLYQLMKFSFGEVCAPEQRDKVMKVWITFLEIMLGIPSRLGKAEGTEDVKANDDQESNNVANVHEGTSISLLITDGGNGSNSDGCPNVACGNDVLGRTNVPQSGAIGTHSSIQFATSGCNQTGQPEQRTGFVLGQMSVNNETASDLQTGSVVAAALDCGIGALLNRDLKVSVGTTSTSFPTAMAPQAVKAQQCHVETEVCVDMELEEGKLACDSNLSEKNIASNNTTALENPSKSSVSLKGTGGEEMCTEEAEGETDVNADDEEMCTQGSTDCENASENGDVSVSESADGEEGFPEEPDAEEGFPEEPDEDGAHNKAESEGEADGTAEGHDNGVLPSSNHISTRRMKPLNMIVPPGLQGKEKNCEIFYGSDSFYILFRLHQILYERMRSAKQHTASPDNKWRILNKASAADAYARFKDTLHSLLNGSSDNTKFEDDCRYIVGAQSYILFTLDKLIHRLVKQLQTIATEEVDNRLLRLYAYERRRGPEKFADVVYHENARFVLPEDNLYRIECRHFPARLTMQLMKNELDKPEVTPVSLDPDFAAYLKEELLSVNPQRKEKLGVFLARNKRKLLTGDEMSDTDKVMDGLVVSNGLEIKIACNTLKAAYVLDTEDYLYRPKKVRKVLYATGTSNGDSNGAALTGGSARGEFYKKNCC